MDPRDESRSIEKHSASSSEGCKRKRPSLMPLRNSAKRKGSMISNNQEPNNILHNS